MDPQSLGLPPDFDLSTIGPGWEGLVQEALTVLKPFPVKITMIKEKFAELRVYYEPRSEEADRALTPILVRSRRTCDQCGEPGLIHKTARGWLLTLCTGCASMPEMQAAPFEWKL